MKKIIPIIIVLTTFISAGISPVFGVPIGNEENRSRYLIEARDLSKFSGGLYARTRKRKISWNAHNQNNMPMKTQKNIVYLGYDIQRFATLYGMYGSNQSRINRQKESSEPEVGLGVRVHLLCHDLFSPHLMEDQIRIAAGIEYSKTGAKKDNDDFDMGELYASIIFSLVNNMEGNKLYWPNAIAIFGGPVYSDLICNQLDHESKTGFAAGLEVFFTERMSFEIGTETFESADWMMGIHTRF